MKRIRMISLIGILFVFAFSYNVFASNLSEPHQYTGRITERESIYGDRDLQEREDDNWLNNLAESFFDSLFDDRDIYYDRYDESLDKGGWYDDRRSDDDWYDDIYSDEEYFDDSYDESSSGSYEGSWNEFPPEDEDTRWWDDEYWEMEQADESELLTWYSGIGSAGKLDGNIVVVSIFVDDERTAWNFNNEKDRSVCADSLSYLKIATDWITEQGQSWGYDPRFYYDWKQDPELIYKTEVYCDITDDEEDPTEELYDYIDQYIDTDGLKTRYEAESILFITYYNTSLRNDVVSFTIPYDDSFLSDYGLDYDFEICYLLVGCDGEYENPASYAHEMLHAFGAPDLYTADNPAYNYNIDSDFVHYCERYHANEIMMTTYDVRTQQSYYDHISNELTDITAYYIGWTDVCEEVDKYHLQESQYMGR